jgi:hypothetical protein
MKNLIDAATLPPAVEAGFIVRRPASQGVTTRPDLVVIDRRMPVNASFSVPLEIGEFIDAVDGFLGRGPVR